MDSFSPTDAAEPQLESVAHGLVCGPVSWWSSADSTAAPAADTPDPATDDGLLGQRTWC